MRNTDGPGDAAEGRVLAFIADAGGEYLCQRLGAPLRWKDVWDGSEPWLITTKIRMERRRLHDGRGFMIPHPSSIVPAFDVCERLHLPAMSGRELPSGVASVQDPNFFQPRCELRYV